MQNKKTQSNGNDLNSENLNSYRINPCKDFENVKDIDCAMCDELLFDYASDYLSEDKKAAVEKHIGLCPKCKESLSEIKGLVSCLGTLPDVEVPKDLEMSIEKALKDAEDEIKQTKFGKDKPKRRVLPFKRYAEIIVPFAAVAALTIGMYQGGIFDRFMDSDKVFEDSGYTESEDLSQRDTGENQIPDNLSESEAFDNKNSADTENFDNSDSKVKTENNSRSNVKNDSGKSNSAKQTQDNKSKKTDSGVKANSQNFDTARSNNKSNNKNETSTKNQGANNNNTLNDSNSSKNDSASSDNPIYSDNVSSVNQETADSGKTSGKSEYENVKPNTDGTANAGGGMSRSSSGGARNAESNVSATEDSGISAYSLGDFEDTADTNGKNSVSVTEDATENTKSNVENKKQIPTGCTIVTSNPAAYSGLGISQGTSQVDGSLWDSITAVARQNGDSLNAYGYSSSDANTVISVNLVVN